MPGPLGLLGRPKMQKTLTRTFCGVELVQGLLIAVDIGCALHWPAAGAFETAFVDACNTGKQE